MLAARRDGVGVVTFNQPEKHNAISVEMWLGLAEILDEFARDDADSHGDPDRRRDAGVRFRRGYQSVRAAAIERRRAARLRRADLASVAQTHRLSEADHRRIRGYCLGGGLAIAMQTDLRIASPDSQFGIRRPSWASPMASKVCGDWSRWSARRTRG